MYTYWRRIALALTVFLLSSLLIAIPQQVRADTTVRVTFDSYPNNTPLGSINEAGMLMYATNYPLVTVVGGKLVMFPTASTLPAINTLTVQLNTPATRLDFSYSLTGNCTLSELVNFYSGSVLVTTRTITHCSNGIVTVNANFDRVDFNVSGNNANSLLIDYLEFTYPSTLLANPDVYTTNEDTPLTIAAPGVLSNDTGVPGVMSLSLPTLPSHGVLAGNGVGGFIYTPHTNFSGVDSFVYGVSSGGVTTTATVTINVNAVNDVPVAVDDCSAGYSTAANTALNIAAPGVLTNDSDVDNSQFMAMLISSPINGTLSLNSDGSFAYTPNANFSGVDSFSYRVNDGLSDSNIVTACINVGQVNTAPVANNDAYSVGLRQTLNVAVPGVLLNDADADSSPMNAALITQPTHGTLTFDANGSFTYTPQGEYVGTDSFTYVATDGSATSNTATVNINILSIVLPEACMGIAFSNAVINGTNGADEITGTEGNDVIDARNGSDQIWGLGGSDCIIAGNGSDEVWGGGGNDVLLGEQSSDELHGGDGDDYIDGGEGHDAPLVGENGNDTIIGGPGHDELYGDGYRRDDEITNPGNDLLTGGSGSDEFRGGEGTDTVTDYRENNDDCRDIEQGC